MSQTTSVERAIILFFRFTMAWTFLYAASNQVFNPKFTVVGFLSHTKTFHDLFAIFTTPTVASITTFLVAYGHLAIGLSLLLGVAVRLSASIGALLMLIYWMAHMDFPYIDTKNNLIIDFHIVYAGVLVFLVAKQAGHVYGLDGWLAELESVNRRPSLRWIVA